MTEQRAIAQAAKIKLSGVLDIELTEGPVTSVKVEADENVLPYVITGMENGFLVVRLRDLLQHVPQRPEPDREEVLGGQ